MSNDFTQFEQRKQDHIALAMLPTNQASEASILDQISFWHEALPNLDFAEIDIASTRFGEKVPNPFMISSMTAGHQGAITINTNLLAAASECNWAMGVGSQRRELDDPNEALIWRKLRQMFPDVTLFSNLGIAQLITSARDDILRITDAISARALIIHCNPLQEALQPEGTPEFKGCLQALEQAVKTLPLPIIVKETGCGFAPATLKQLHDIGVHAVDVSGLGGTHWGRIEGHRAPAHSHARRAAQVFGSWGMDTVRSIKFARELSPSYEIWGSGGVRHGLDAAKLLALGATTVGFAKNMLAAALQSGDAVSKEMAAIEYELKLALFCTGSRVLTDLQGKICPTSK
ncbi:MAG: type 2 isopentenyl-diphosphate Delta-isomerase [Gammaproteobacteria bacterium]